MYFEVTLAAFQKCVELNWFSKSENLVASKLRLILVTLRNVNFCLAKVTYIQEYSLEFKRVLLFIRIHASNKKYIPTIHSPYDYDWD